MAEVRLKVECAYAVAARTCLNNRKNCVVSNHKTVPGNCFCIQDLGRILAMHQIVLTINGLNIALIDGIAHSTVCTLICCGHSRHAWSCACTNTPTCTRTCIHIATCARHGGNRSRSACCIKAGPQRIFPGEVRAQTRASNRVVCVRQPRLRLRTDGSATFQCADCRDKRVDTTVLSSTAAGSCQRACAERWRQVGRATEGERQIGRCASR